jgi:predicted enzyme related to lactoylglutathione lyase
MATYTHTNIVSADPERLGRFYIEVFGCERTGPDRTLEGEWIGRGTGHPGITVRGFMLRLPGHGESGPTLEIFSVEGGGADNAPSTGSILHGGYTHMAFIVDDVHATLDQIVAAGGSKLGEIVRAQAVEGLGAPDFVYARDPEGNILELLDWTPRG